MSYYTEGNILSILAFFVWVPVALYGSWRLPPAKAMAWLYLGGLLLLPQVVFFKPAGLPEFGKLELITLWIFVGALLFHRERLKSPPRNWSIRVCIGLLVIGAVITIFTNSDELRIGSRYLPGQVPYDAVHEVINALLHSILPFYLGAVMFRTSSDLRVLLKAVVVAALIYSLLQILEMILSPQLHRWVYGFHQHFFGQAMRGGGYRPMVFMQHGLAVSLFTCLSVVAAASLYKAKETLFNRPLGRATVYLWVIVAAVRSSAALVYSFIAVPLALLASTRAQARASAALVAVLLLYPVARAADLVPVEDLGTAAEEQFGAERAHSLTFRFENEERLLDRAMERPWFGWGRYCRACLFEPWTGEGRSVRDGAWIIQLGDLGFVGFFGRFLLLWFPVIALVRRMKLVSRRSDRHLLAGLSLMIGVSAFDLIPNADYTRFVLVLSGALLGCLTGIVHEAALVRRRQRLSRAAAAKTAVGPVPAALLGLASVLTSWVIPASALAEPDAVGGGFTSSGLVGAYYADTELEGAPSFTRRDVRIDFDWDGVRPVGGSTAEPYRSFPRHGFSVRWHGGIIARFDEAYRLRGDVEGGIRIRVRGPGESAWTILVDRWNDTGKFQSRPFSMQAGKTYDIEVEYRATNGRSHCRLEWDSESTPLEVIDPVRQQGLNIASDVWADYVWADLMKSRHYDEGRETIDARGWPMASRFHLIVSELEHPRDPEMSGSYLLRFSGRARVYSDCCVDTAFQANGRVFEGKLPRGVGYDPVTNRTTAVMSLSGSRSMVFFEEAARNSDGRETGLSDIQLMRPIAPGSRQHHRVDEVVYRPFKQVLQDNFTLVRRIGSIYEGGGDWSQRTLPDYAFFIGMNRQENWEYQVILANETGRDLYITIPIGADDEYFEKLARLLRYGSDGHEPYRGPVAEPIYPPLNSNLRVYVEMDNEIWNWAFPTTQVAQRLTEEEYHRRSPTWKAINYDGQAGEPSGITAIRRWHAVRTVEASNAFRRVWGDAAMGARVRVLLEYQYDNFQDTALSSLDFIDGYYNNRRNENVEEPHPVNFFLWGGGGAAYYGLANPTGEQSHTVVRDPSFEATPIEPSSVRARPSGTAWTFAGRAGLIRPEGAKQIAGFDNLPSPSSGKQAAFLTENGSISQRVRFTKPGTYAIAFNAAGAAQGWPEYHPFDILVDGRKVSPREQSDHRVSPARALIGGWGRNMNSLEEEWGSAIFQIEEADTLEITFVGREVDHVEPSYLLIDNVRIVSADALVTSGFDEGEAQGQESEPDLALGLRRQATYARAFGLEVVAYEAGWSVGGDFHSVPIQSWCKLADSRAAEVNDRAIGYWDQSGGFLPVWGVYLYWPSYDLEGAAEYPIMQSFRRASQRLRSEPTYGRSIPATLRPSETDWSHQDDSNESSWRRFIPSWRRFIPWLDDPVDGWHSWMLIAPKTGTYTLRVYGRGTGRLVVEVDGDPVAELKSLSSAGDQPVQVMLTQGAHAVRVVTVGSKLEFNRVEVGP